MFTRNAVGTVVLAFGLLGFSVTSGRALAQPASAVLSPEAFLEELQTALARDDRPAVADLMRYPLTVHVGGLRVPIADAAAFVAGYDTIVTSGLKAIVAATAVPVAGQPASRYTLRADGPRLLMAGGLVEARAEPEGFRITRLDVPLSVPEDLALRQRSPRPPRRLSARAGGPAVRTSGTLVPGSADHYLVRVDRGRLLEARIQQVRNRDAVVRVVDAETGLPLDARAGEGVRTWTGRVPDGGDYRLEVTRTSEAGDPALPYALSVRIR